MKRTTKTKKNDDEEDDSEDEDEDEEDEDEDEDEDDEEDEDDGSATADPAPDPAPGTVPGGQDDIAVDDADADEHEDEDEDDEGEEDDPFPGVPGTLNATIGGTATFQAGVFGDLTHGVQFRNKTELDFNVRGKADNGLLYGLKLQLETVTGHESDSETTFDEAYVYIGGTWGRLEFGDTDDVVAGGLVIYAPSVGIGQVDGDYGSFSRLSLDDYYPFYPDIGTSTKINYYTPRIAGFQAGISYSPHLADNGQSVVAFRPGRVRATTASAPSRSLSSASAVPRTAIQTASLGPRTVTRASAPPPARAAQTVDDDDDDGEDSEDDSDGDEGEDDEARTRTTRARTRTRTRARTTVPMMGRIPTSRARPIHLPLSNLPLSRPALSNPPRSNPPRSNPAPANRRRRFRPSWSLSRKRRSSKNPTTKTKPNPKAGTATSPPSP